MVIENDNIANYIFIQVTNQYGEELLINGA